MEFLGDVIRTAHGWNVGPILRTVTTGRVLYEIDHDYVAFHRFSLSPL